MLEALSKLLKGKYLLPDIHNFIDNELLGNKHDYKN